MVVCGHVMVSVSKVQPIEQPQCNPTPSLTPSIWFTWLNEAL